MEIFFNFSSSAEDIFATLTTPTHIEEKYASLGSITSSAQSDESELPRITILRTENFELPSLMKKVVGTEQQTKTVEQWSGTDESYDSQSTTKVVGTPIAIDVQQCLYNTEEGSEIVVKLHVKANIPLIGKKVEPMVASKIRKELLREFEYLDSQFS